MGLSIYGSSLSTAATILAVSIQQHISEMTENVNLIFLIFKKIIVSQREEQLFKDIDSLRGVSGRIPDHVSQAV